MANAIAMLQIAANRFAQSGNFAPVSVDGVMGPATASAVHAALSVVQGDVPEESDNAATLNATLDQNQMTQSASGLATYLNQNADALGFGSPAVSTGGGLSPTPAMPGSPFATNLSLMWANLPVPAKIGGGLLAVAGLVMLVRHLSGGKRHGRALHGVNLGEDYIDAEAHEAEEAEEGQEAPEFDESDEG
jgi:hypothetical protein